MASIAARCGSVLGAVVGRACQVGEARRPQGLCRHPHPIPHGPPPHPQVWALESLTDLLAQPHAFRRPFLPREALRVDRPLADLAEFEWRGYRLHAFEFPGQTDLHACYATAVDGRRVVFSGDNFYPPQQWGGTGGLSGLNGGHPRHWRASIELLLQLQPDWILAAHVQPFPYRRADFEAMLSWSEAVSAAMQALAPDGCLERHHDPHLIELMPDRQSLAGARGRPLPPEFNNPYPQPIEVDVALVLPTGWSIARAHRRLAVPAGGRARASWSPRVDDPGSAKAWMLTVDVLYEGEYLGQKAECYIYR